MNTSKVTCCLLALFCYTIAHSAGSATSKIGMVKTNFTMPEQPVFVSDQSDVDLLLFDEWAKESGAELSQHMVQASNDDLALMMLLVSFE